MTNLALKDEIIAKEPLANINNDGFSDEYAKHLAQVYDKMANGKSKMYTLEQIEAMADATIAKHKWIYFLARIFGLVLMKYLISSHLIA